MKIDRKVSLLDWIIILSIILLIIVVYIPSMIWKEEKIDRDESRHRMKTIAYASEFYKEITDDYTVDGEQMFLLIEAATDSLYSDNLFTGPQTIIINGTIKKVNIEDGFDYRADTTFSFPQKIKKTVIDTVFMITEYKDPTSKIEIDTSYVNSFMIKKAKEKPTFKEIINTEIKERVEIKNDHLRGKFHPSREHTCILNGSEKYEGYCSNLHYKTQSECLIKVCSNPIYDNQSDCEENEGKENNQEVMNWDARGVWHHTDEFTSLESCEENCNSIAGISGQCEMTYLVCPLTKRPYILEDVFDEYCRNKKYMTKQECEREVCSLKTDISFFSKITHKFLSFFEIRIKPEKIDNKLECSSYNVYKWEPSSWIVDDYYLVKSPVTEDDSERRYLFFKYTPGDHGFIKIEDGHINISWAE